jgi:DNA-binding XRE family transcriptional regulator
MKLSELTTSEQIAAAEARDPQVAAELEQSSVAEQLALWLIRYRVEHGLSQAALARLVGMKQPAIARLEAGDHEPSLTTLARLSRALDVALTLDIAPQSVVLQSA